MSPAGSQRRHRSRRAAFAAARPVAPPTPWLLTATDLGLFGAMVLVPACLGGRTPTGHLMLVLVAAWTAVCWSMHQCISQHSRFVWTRTEAFWLAGVALAGLQLTELSPGWLDALSPQHRQLLGIAEYRFGDTVLWPVWQTLSLAPRETTAALATFFAYGLLFFVGVQRLRDRTDIEQALRAIAAVTVGWAVFSLLHYLFANGKFLWVFVHPQVATTDYNTGPFITRNHFAHFLALGSAPLLWWWLSPPATERSGIQPAKSGFGVEAVAIDLRQIAFAVALALVVVACVLTSSRGGLAAMGIAMFVTLAALNRVGRVTTSCLAGLSAAGLIIAGFAIVGGTDALAKRIDSHGPETRYLIWQANLDLVKSFPWFGTGVGTHASAHRLFVDISDRGLVFTHAESSYLQVASECGLAGLALAVVMAALVLWWPLRTLFAGMDSRDRTVAAAVLGSVVAHLAHATVDFLWYAPGCMVVVALLAAIGRRGSQLTSAIGSQEWQPPKVCWGLATAGSLLLGAWMVQEKLPAARAEGSVTTYRLLTRQLDDDAVRQDPQELARLERERARIGLRIHQLDPLSSKWSASASTQYLKLFDLKQEQSEQPMSLVMLRDAVQASEWDSPDAMREWIGKVTGKNQKWLDAAWQSALDAVRNEPLEGPAYLHLSRLSFLKDSTGELQRKLIARALRVRPHDPDILISAGQEVALHNDLPRAIKFWQQAFPRGAEFQKKIARMLAPTRSPADMVRDFQPGWQACLVLRDAYAAAGRDVEFQEMQRHLAEAALTAARAAQDSLAVSAWITASSAYRELGDGDRSVAILQEALERDPNQFEVRRTLGANLLMLERYAEAAEHLRWAAMRRPEDSGLREATEHAIRESHRTPSPMREGVTPVGFQAVPAAQQHAEWPVAAPR